MVSDTMSDSLFAVLVGQVEPVPVDFEDLVDDGLTGPDWIQAGVVVVVAVVVAVVVNRIARKIGERTIGQGFASLLIARSLGYVIVLVGVIYALGGLGVRIGPLLGALGIGGLVLALALQGVAENFFGGYLQSRRPFTIGDTVELGEHIGVVKDIDSRTVVMRSLDGTWFRVPILENTSSGFLLLLRQPVTHGVRHHE